MYKLRVPDHLVEFIRSLHPEIKRKIKGSLKNIATDPNAGKPLKDELEGLRSFRVSRFYEETYRLIRKESKGR